MTAYSRQGNKWTINEMLSLQREYELLELTVPQIAEKHQRSETAILYKLDSEGLIDSWYDARGFNYESFKSSFASVEATQDVEQEVGGDDDEDYQFEDSDDDNITDDVDQDYESEVEKLTERVWSLETSVGEISSMVKNIYSILSSNKNSKRKSLRASSSA